MDKKTPKFRKESKHWFLTYPKVSLPIRDDGLGDKEGYLADVEKRLRDHHRTVVRHVVSLEQHEDGTPHLHAYLNLDESFTIRDPRFFDWAGNHPNLQAARSPKDVSRYCAKNGDFIANFPVNEPPKNSRRELGKKILAATDLAKLVEDEPELILSFKRIVENVNLFKLYKEKPVETEDVRGVWIWGKAGIGKSHAVRKACGADLYLKSANKWWDGYQGQRNVLWDDLEKDCNKWCHHYLKVWADKYAVIAEVKGGTIPLQHTRFIVTSNYHPATLWPDTEDLALHESVVRRFIIYEMIHRCSCDSIFECICNAVQQQD